VLWSLILVLLAIALGAGACRLRRPTTLRILQPQYAGAVWATAHALLAAGAVTAVRMALGVVAGDSGLGGPWELLVRGEVVALVAVLLLVGLAETETPRALLLACAAGAALASGLLSAALRSLGAPLEPDALVGAAAAAVLAPLLLSAAGRARLIARARSAAVAGAGDQLLVVDEAGRVLHASDVTRRTLKLSSCNEPPLPSALTRLIGDTHPHRARFRTRSGRILDAWGTRGHSRGPLARVRGILIRDVTRHYRDKERLVRLAHYDSLTGLANRRLFLETLTEALEDADRDASLVGLLYIDLDDFKSINDSLGHGAGDRLLEVVSERFRVSLGIDEVGRFGLTDSQLHTARLSGDEFAVIVSQLSSPQPVYDLADWILKFTAQPFELGDRTIRSSASIGIAISPDDGRDVDSLMGHADTALYSAKARGRRRYARFDASFDKNAERSQQIESGLRRAIERHELRLFYQPKVDVRTGTVTGLEALMRWRSTELGDVGPAEFIPVAEECGLVSDLGTWALRRACHQIRDWRESGFSVVPVAVNISSHQFNEVDLQSVVSEALHSQQVDPQLLELELTESLLLGQGEEVELVLRDLRAIGVRIALDDFGTGYSALTYLSRFNLDVLKMDRGLLRDIDTNPSAAGIASAVVSMAHNLGLTVVAEGVDSEAQVPILRDMRCDQIQGFLYSPALPPEEVVRYLARVGKPAPRCGSGADAAVPDESPEAVASEYRDAPALRETTSAGTSDALEEVEIDRPDQGRVLMVDDGDEAVGLAALRLNRLGIDTHYASGLDEARLFVAQENENIRVVAAAPSVDLENLRSLMSQLTDLCGERRRLIAIGERPDEKRRIEVREAGVDWVLWAPFNDAELRCLMRSAMVLSLQVADHREPRVPVDLVATISSGKRREVAVVSSLSPRGAFIEMNDPPPLGSSLRIEMEMPSDHFRGFARVVHTKREGDSQALEPSGMGVAFFGSDRDMERILRKAVKELESRYLP
jgi:diguanylate cyclase (GGDEF)-like protein